MKNLLKKKSFLMGTALTITVLIMVPLITGAAPITPPPTGTVIPTFSGENIKNSGGTTTLNINGDGLLSNPNTGSVMVKDTEGLLVYGEGIGANYYSISPTDGISAKSTGAGTPSVVIYDPEGMAVSNGSRINFAVSGSGSISNPNGPVSVGDDLTATGVSTFKDVNVFSTNGLKIGDNSGTIIGLAINAAGDISNPTANPVKIADPNGLQLVKNDGTDSYKFFNGYITNLGTECADGPCPPGSIVGSPIKFSDDDGLNIMNGSSSGSYAWFKGSSSRIISDKIDLYPSTDGVKIEGDGGSNVDLKVNGRLRTGDANNYGGMWVAREGNPYSLFMGQYDTSRLGFYNNGAWRFLVDSWGNYYNPSKNFTVDDNLDVTGYIETPDKTIDGVNYTNAMCTTDGGEVYMTGGAGTTIWVCLLPVRTGGKLTADRLEANYITAKTNLSSTGKITAAGGFGTLNKVTTTNSSMAYPYSSASASCPSGQMLLSCGYYAKDPLTMTAYRINPDTSYSSCTVSFYNSSTSTKSVEVYALCLNPAA